MRSHGTRASTSTAAPSAARRSATTPTAGSLPPIACRLVAVGSAPDERVAAKEQISDLWGAFGDLSESHHRILIMRELEGLSYSEIGDRLGMSRAAVESTLFRARRRLTEEYDEHSTGRRCGRIQGIIAAAAAGQLTARDRRRMSRHLGSCERCRRDASSAGIELPARRSLGERLGGLLPFPVALRLRMRRADGISVGRAVEPHGMGTLAQWSLSLGTAAEPLGSGLVRVAAAAATLVVAVAGTSAVNKAESSPVGGGRDRPGLVAPAQTKAAASGSTAGGASQPPAGTTPTGPTAAQPDRCVQPDRRVEPDRCLQPDRRAGAERPGCGGAFRGDIRRGCARRRPGRSGRTAERVPQQ